MLGDQEYKNKMLEAYRNLFQAFEIYKSYLTNPTVLELTKIYELRAAKDDKNRYYTKTLVDYYCQPALKYSKTGFEG